MPNLATDSRSGKKEQHNFHLLQKYVTDKVFGSPQPDVRSRAFFVESSDLA